MFFAVDQLLAPMAEKEKMNLKHLGDALDFWKGSLLGRLKCNLNNVHILPMFTDNWSPTNLDCYARLFRVDTPKILKENVLFSADARATYFDKIPNLGNDDDLFVDPDIGIEPPSGGTTKHIRFNDIEKLQQNGSKRVVLIYQHSCHEDKWIKPCLDQVNKAIKNAPGLNGCHAFAYWAGYVAMIFISRDQQRVCSLTAALRQIYPTVQGQPQRVFP
jgi:hypothetical protein